MQESWDAKVKGAEKELKALLSEVEKWETLAGCEVAQDPAYSELDGWTSAHAAWKEVDKVLEEIETAEYHAEEWSQTEERITASRGLLAQLEQKHRAALLAMGRAAWKLLQQGSPNLEPLRYLYAEVELIEEREKVRHNNDRMRAGEAQNFLQKLAAGAGSAWDRLRNSIDEGRKKSLFQEAGKELMFHGAYEVAFPVGPSLDFESLTTDLDAWKKASGELRATLSKLEELKSQAEPGGFPFDLAVRRLRVQLQGREAEAAPLYANLYAAWENAGFEPPGSALVKPLVEKVEEKRDRKNQVHRRLEEAEAGLHAEKLTRDAAKNRAKAEQLYTESRRLSDLAGEQEKEAVTLWEKAGVPASRSDGH